MVSYVLNHFLRKFVKEEGLKATKVNFRYGAAPVLATYDPGYDLRPSPPQLE